MAHQKQPRLVRLRVVLEADFDFDADEPPSLGGIPYTDTTGTDITHVTRSAGLRKCGQVEPERRRKGGAR